MSASQFTPGDYLIGRAGGSTIWSKDGECFTVERHFGDLRSVLCRINPAELCPEHGGSALGNAVLFASATKMYRILRDSLPALERGATSPEECLRLEEARSLVADVEGRR